MADTTTTLLGTAASIVSSGALWKVFRYTQRKYSQAKTHFEKIHAMLTKVDSLGTQVGEITKQVTNNGGGSLKDKIEDCVRSCKETSGMLRVVIVKDQLRDEHDPRPMFKCDENGCCVYVNRALAELYGMDQSQMLGNNWLKAIPDPEERQEVFNTWQHSVANNVPYLANYTVQNARNGNVLLDCTAEATAMTDQNKIIGYVGFVRLRRATQSNTIKP